MFRSIAKMQQEVEFEALSAQIIHLPQTNPHLFLQLQHDCHGSVYAWDVNMCAHEAYLWECIRIQTPDLYSTAAGVVNAKYTSQMNFINLLRKCGYSNVPEVAHITYVSKLSYCQERRNVALEAFKSGRSLYHTTHEKELLFFTTAHTTQPNLQEMAALATHLKMNDRELQLWFTQHQAKGNILPKNTIGTQQSAYLLEYPFLSRVETQQQQETQAIEQKEGQ